VKERPLTVSQKSIEHKGGSKRWSAPLAALTEAMATVVGTAGRKEVGFGKQQQLVEGHSTAERELGEGMAVN